MIRISGNGLNPPAEVDERSTSSIVDDTAITPFRNGNIYVIDATHGCGGIGIARSVTIISSLGHDLTINTLRKGLPMT
jgi:hypothetical protein